MPTASRVCPGPYSSSRRAARHSVAPSAFAQRDGLAALASRRVTETLPTRQKRTPRHLSRATAKPRPAAAGGGGPRQVREGGGAVTRRTGRAVHLTGAGWDQVPAARQQQQRRMWCHVRRKFLLRICSATDLSDARPRFPSSCSHKNEEPLRSTHSQL